jgi:N-acetyltransferase B complex (NatB) non catalytic subunit
MKKMSFLAELELKLCLALNSKTFQTYEGSPLFNLVLDYLELFYDKTDVVMDLIPYLKLMTQDDSYALREKVKTKIDSLESGFVIPQSALAGNKLPDIKVIRWKIVLHKLSKVLGAYQSLERNERMTLVNMMFQVYVHGHA